LGKFSLKEVALIPVKFMLGKISFDNKVIYALAVGIAGLVFGYLIFKGFKKAGPWLRLWLVVPIALAVLVSFRLPILGYFRLLFVLPAFYLLLARGIESLPKNWRVVGLMFILFINLTSSILYLASPRFHREDWRGAADAVGDEKIIFPAKSQKEALIYYGREKQIIDIDELKGEENPIWLSRYIWEVFDPTDAARKKVESLGYNKVSVSNFNGVILFKYAYRD
jgi:hypothetical protein